jgi:hypothetical protein
MIHFLWFFSFWIVHIIYGHFIDIFHISLHQWTSFYWDILTNIYKTAVYDVGDSKIKKITRSESYKNKVSFWKSEKSKFLHLCQKWHIWTLFVNFIHTNKNLEYSFIMQRKMSSWECNGIEIFNFLFGRSFLGHPIYAQIATTTRWHDFSLRSSHQTTSIWYSIVSDTVSAVCAKRYQFEWEKIGVLVWIMCAQNTSAIAESTVNILVTK